MKKNKLNRRNFIKKTTTSSFAALALPSIVPSSVFGKNAPSNKIQIGQIGCGRIARVHDMPGTMQHDSAQMIAVCDLDLNRMKDGKILVDQYYAEKGKKVETSMYENYQEMLSNKEIDAVIISTPDHWHAQPALELSLIHI